MFCIVIPTYKEKENLEKHIPEIQETHEANRLDGHILIVDDNSPDGTGAYVEELSKTQRNIHLLRRPCKMGLGSAYRDGFKYAFERLGVDVVFEMDADGSHPPKHIPDFLAKLTEGSDVVVGSRYIAGGGVVGWGIRRKLISRAANMLARVVAGVKIHDATSGYRAFTRKAVEKLGFEKVKSGGFSFQVETLFQAQKAKLKIGEVPFTFIDRERGESKMGLKEIVAFASTCLRLLFKRG